MKRSQHKVKFGTKIGARTVSQRDMYSTQRKTFNFNTSLT